MLTKRQKENSMRAVKRHDTDSGSPEVQIAILTKEIDELTKHLKHHPKDDHSRRGLLQMVSNRRKHIKYLQKHNNERYNEIAKKLGLKASK